MYSECLLSISAGFLSTGDRYSPGNYGMFDQVQALKFIRETVTGFRGDPNRITIMGQSAGAASVGLHLIPPRSDSTHSSLYFYI